MKGGGTGGGDKIARSSRNGGKRFRRDAALFREQRHEAGIWLVGRKATDGSACNSAAQLDGVNHFFHARDGGTRECFAVELDCEATVLFIINLDRGGILPCATKNKFTETLESTPRRRKALAPSPKSPPNSPATRPGVSVRV